MTEDVIILGQEEEEGNNNIMEKSTNLNHNNVILASDSLREEEASGPVSNLDNRRRVTFRSTNSLTNGSQRSRLLSHSGADFQNINAKKTINNVNISPKMTLTDYGTLISSKKGSGKIRRGSEIISDNSEEASSQISAEGHGRPLSKKNRRFHCGEADTSLSTSSSSSRQICGPQLQCRGSVVTDVYNNSSHTSATTTGGNPNDNCNSKNSCNSSRSSSSSKIRDNFSYIFVLTSLLVILVCVVGILLCFLKSRSSEAEEDSINRENKNFLGRSSDSDCTESSLQIGPNLNPVEKSRLDLYVHLERLATSKAQKYVGQLVYLRLLLYPMLHPLLSENDRNDRVFVKNIINLIGNEKRHLDECKRPLSDDNDIATDDMIVGENSNKSKKSLGSFTIARKKLGSDANVITNIKVEINHFYSVPEHKALKFDNVFFFL